MTEKLGWIDKQQIANEGSLEFVRAKLDAFADDYLKYFKEGEPIPFDARNLKGEGMGLVFRLLHEYQMPMSMQYRVSGYERELIIGRDGKSQFAGQTRVYLINDLTHWNLKFSSVFDRFERTGVDHSIFNNNFYQTSPISEIRKVRFALNFLDAAKANVAQVLQQRRIMNSISQEQTIFAAS
jgi:hypothetical protein